VTVCCRSVSRRRSTVACCAGRQFAVNSSSAQAMAAVRVSSVKAWAMASLRCNLRRRGGPKRWAPGFLPCAHGSAAQPVVLVSAASAWPVPRNQHMPRGCMAAADRGVRDRAAWYGAAWDWAAWHWAAPGAPLRVAKGCCADCACPHCRRDIWWRIG
jgi:hypothetical protein